MSQQVSHNKVIAKNATMLYFRMFFTLAISFYSSRIVLRALGVSDYGIYNVVGGVIALINVLTSSLGTATSRFLTYSLGKGSLRDLQITFSTAYYIHVMLALSFLLLAETIGLWFVNTQLVIPEGRMVAANWVYQSAILSTVLGITQVPYDAAINAHEKMGTFAYLQILNAILKLGIAFIVLIATIDHLILYSVLYVSLSIAFLLYYRYYCKRNFAECSLIFVLKKTLFKQMLAFSAWSMFGNVTNTIKDQGLNVLLNRFFGTLLNAAAGVAGQVMGILSAFAGNITLAFRPQIVKEYAAGNYTRFNYLICMGTKFQVIVCILSIVPIFFNIDFLMGLWLDVVPNGAVVLCQVLLINTIFFSLDPFVYYGIVATGRVRNVNLSLGFLYILALVLFYVTLKITGSYVLTYIINLLVSPISIIIYVIILRKTTPFFDTKVFVVYTLFPLILLAFSSFFLAWLITLFVDNVWIKLFGTFLICSPFICSMSYFFLLDVNTKAYCKKYIFKKLHLSNT